MDEVFENILVDSGARQSLFKMGKIGVLWELDRKTGKFLNAFDLGYQTLMKIDRADRQGHLSPGRDSDRSTSRSTGARALPASRAGARWRITRKHRRSTFR